MLKAYNGIVTLASIARMLQTQANANIVSTPNLITLDNEEAKIVVGENVPFITGQFTNTGTAGAAVNPFQTIERKDVGVTLRIRPQIGEGGAVRMTVFQEQSSVKTDTAAGTTNAGPSTSKRSIEGTVTVDDGQILVLGGLIEDRYINIKSKVPLLGDLPLLGALFRSESRERRRTNLIVFLRPIVMRDAESANKFSVDRYEQIRGRQETSQPLTQLRPADQRGGGAAGQSDGRDPHAADRRHDGPAAGAADGRRRRNRRTLPWPSATPCTTPLPRPTTLLLEDDGESLVLWAGETTPASALSEVTRQFDVARFEREAAATLGQRIAAAYAGGESSAAAVIGEVESGVDLSRMMQDLPAVEDLLEAADDAPIIRMLNALLTQAAKDGASDIHIEPYERSSSVRFRVDGTLREVVQPNKALHAALISRLKIMAELDIAERRLPQDGRISLRIGGRAIDVRVSTLPSSYGERAVLRLLDKTESKFTLEGLGMSGDVLSAFERLIQQPHGIVLVTGPTGSGKTTTLYASLGRIDTAGTNVLTVEDPVEYELPGIGQTQVNPKIDLTFRQGAARHPAPGPRRHHDRRDPRHRDRADRHPGLAHRPPGAGHRAHQRRAEQRHPAHRHGRGAVPAVEQPAGRAGAAPGAQAVPALQAPGRRRPLAPGGLRALRHERLQGPHRRLRADGGRPGGEALIHNRAPEHELVAAARACGLRSMREDGERLVREGITSLEEVIRVTRDRDFRADCRTDRANAAEPALPGRWRCPTGGGAAASGGEMPAYRFEALDAAGKSLSGLLEADNARTARAQLRARELVPLAVTPVSMAANEGSGPRFTRRVFTPPGWRCGRASSPAWWARACRWSVRSRRWPTNPRASASANSWRT